MQQKFKAREEKAKKEHRDEMGQVWAICVWVTVVSQDTKTKLKILIFFTDMKLKATATVA